MVIVSTIALSIMISNNLVTPFLINSSLLKDKSVTDISERFLNIRRLSIVFVLLFAYGYFSLIDNYSLVCLVNNVNSDYHKVKLEIRNKSWVEIFSNSNSLQVGNMDTTYAKLTATGLINGTYSSSFTINSDDPITPVVTIPVSFTVQGVPEIELSTDSINFGGEIISTTSSLDFIIDNPSCSVLDITNIISSDTAYTVSDTLFSVPPFSSNSITVTFSPGQIINYPATLTILNSDTTQVINLVGQGLAKPIISTNTDSININFTSCNDTVIVPVTIYNTGAGVLDYNIILTISN